MRCLIGTAAVPRTQTRAGAFARVFCGVLKGVRNKRKGARVCGRRGIEAGVVRVCLEVARHLALRSGVQCPEQLRLALLELELVLERQRRAVPGAATSCLYAPKFSDIDL